VHFNNISCGRAYSCIASRDNIKRHTRQKTLLLVTAKITARLPVILVFYFVKNIPFDATSLYFATFKN